MLRAHAPQRRLSLLLVDDERRYLDSLALALDGLHDVVTETDAAKALALVTGDPTRFDAVLCDLAMPVADGPAFHARMAELGVGSRFVLMTGGAFTARARAFVDGEVCARIEKPFRIDDLLQLLDRVGSPVSPDRIAS